MDRIRVLTLNIWNRQGPWDERLPMIQRGIAALDPDIIGLQEVICSEGRSQADDIAAGLPSKYEAAFGVAHDVGGGVHFGNAVLSRWPITRSAPVPLPTGFSDESRCVFFAEVGTPFGPVPFFVTHLNWKFHEGNVREAQVMAIAEQVRKEAPLEGLPPILVGDFNAQPESSEIRFLKGLQSLQGKASSSPTPTSRPAPGRGTRSTPPRTRSRPRRTSTRAASTTSSCAGRIARCAASRCSPGSSSPRWRRAWPPPITGASTPS